MGRIKHLKNSLILTAVYLLILLVFWIFKIPCFFKHFLKIPCPGCGMTRAMISVIHLDFIKAFSYHPMFWSMPILYLYFLFNGRLFNQKHIDRGILIFISVGFLVNWIANLI